VPARFAKIILVRRKVAIFLAAHISLATIGITPFAARKIKFLRNKRISHELAEGEAHFMQLNRFVRTWANDRSRTLLLFVVWAMAIVLSVSLILFAGISGV
jgi:hypothetical protein